MTTESTQIEELIQEAKGAPTNPVPAEVQEIVDPLTGAFERFVRTAPKPDLELMEKVLQEYEGFFSDPDGVLEAAILEALGRTHVISATTEEEADRSRQLIYLLSSDYWIGEFLAHLLWESKTHGNPVTPGEVLRILGNEITDFESGLAVARKMYQHYPELVKGDK